jgi:predicted nucleic acid-binding protein
LRLIVADTGPLNYLLLIGHIEILPILFDKVIVPPAVSRELLDPNTPLPVRSWISDPPAWVEISNSTPALAGASLLELD